jgi:hypothetical protein
MGERESIHYSKSRNQLRKADTAVGKLDSDSTVRDSALPPKNRRSAGDVSRKPERVAEVHRVATREPIQVQPPGQPNGVLLRKSPDRRDRLRPQAHNPLPIAA